MAIKIDLIGKTAAISGGAGGMGMMLTDTLAAHPIMANKTVRILALPDEFVKTETEKTIFTTAGIDREAIVRAVRG